jgi:activating signal cointegrator complex subunit 1
MESEFTRELDKLSAAESETATFWQGKHSALHQSFLRTDTDLRVLRGEAERWVKERDELRAERDMLRREAREREDEVAMLMSQVRGLKEWVSTSTRADGAAVTSDEVFAEGMANLGNGLQNWVVVNFRKAKLGMILDDVFLVQRATLDRATPDCMMLTKSNQTYLTPAKPRWRSLTGSCPNMRNSSLRPRYICYSQSCQGY